MFPSDTRDGFERAFAPHFTGEAVALVGDEERGRYLMRGCSSRPSRHSTWRRAIRAFAPPHGTQWLHPFDQFPNPPSPAQSRERFGAFGAYYVPDCGAAALPDTLSIVNVFRHVFGHYFGADLPPLPNAMYFSDWRTPYTLTEIDTLTYAATAPRATAPRR